MNNILIEPKNKSEEQFIAQLLDKLDIASRKLSSEDMEDAGLSLLMKKADRSKKVSPETIMKKLNK